MPRYIALLRGINVGGNTMIKMTDLKAAFEACGFENVVTYINSGNLAFDVGGGKSRGNKTGAEASLVELIEQAIEKEFGKQIPVMVREQKDISRILANNPYDGQYASHKEMHVLFLKDSLPADREELLMNAALEGERYSVNGREIYCHLPTGVADSLLTKGFIDKKMKVLFTGRNWRTVEKLAVL